MEAVAAFPHRLPSGSLAEAELLETEAYNDYFSTPLRDTENRKKGLFYSAENRTIFKIRRNSGKCGAVMHGLTCAK